MVLTRGYGRNLERLCRDYCDVVGLYSAPAIQGESEIRMVGGGGLELSRLTDQAVQVSGRFSDPPVIHTQEQMAEGRRTFQSEGLLGGQGHDVFKKDPSLPEIMLEKKGRQALIFSKESTLC